MSARREQELAERELELARSIQRRLLPPAEFGGNGFRVSARNLPARFVAGDFYDVFELAGGKIGLVVADVAGKGIGASLITASVKAMTPLIAERRSVTETLERLNDKLCVELTSREFVALSLALFDPVAGTIELANSGLPDPYLMRPGCEPEMIDVPGPAPTARHPPRHPLPESHAATRRRRAPAVAHRRSARGAHRRRRAAGLRPADRAARARTATAQRPATGSTACSSGCARRPPARRRTTSPRSCCRLTRWKRAAISDVDQSRSRAANHSRLSFDR